MMIKECSQLSTETYGVRKVPISEKEEMKYNKTIQQNISLNDVIKDETKEYYPNWSKNLDHLHRILIIGDPGSG